MGLKSWLGTRTRRPHPGGPDPQGGADEVSSLISRAAQAQQQGSLAEAKSLYLQAARLAPEHAELRYLLGSVLGELGELEAAREHLSYAAAALPELAEAPVGLGHVLRGQGDPAAACAAYQRALELDERCEPARRGLAHALAELGRAEEAQAHLQRLLAAGAALPEDLLLAGNLALEAGRPEDARAAFARGAQAAPETAALHYNNLGVALARLGRDREALGAHRRAVELQPGYADAHYNAGLLEARLGNPARAIADFEAALAVMPEFLAARRQRALCLAADGECERALAALAEMSAADPELAELHLDRAEILCSLGRLEECERAQRAAVAADPQCASAYSDLGMTLAQRGAFGEARRALERSLELDPDLAEAHNNLGSVHAMRAELTEARAAYRRALALAPSRLEWRSNLLTCANYDAAEDSAALHREWAAALETRLAPQGGSPGFLNSREPGRRLRVGYLSADFRAHSVAYFIAGLLRAHDSAEVETVALSDVRRPDAVTARIRERVDQWRPVSDLDDARLAELIREQRVDILVDLAGHSTGNRLGVLARRPAPVQVTYLGYPNTTGLEAVDLRLTDALADPPGDDQGYTETLIRLPRCFLAYEPPEGAPPVAPRPSSSGGPVSFVSFNELLKMGPEVVRTWSALLHQVPGANLTLKGSALGDPETRDRVEERFGAEGIGAERLVLLGRTESLAEHLGLYGRADIALDTFPYNGTTTTCEALWMGVPVVTLAAGRHAGRVGASLLSALGLGELVADTPEDFVHRAAELGRRPDRVQSLSSELRERMRHSELADHEGLARAVEAVYRNAWRRWCAGSVQAH